MTYKTDSKERDLMALVDAYAEARHIGGCHTYNAKTAEARAKVVASLPANAGSEPVALDPRHIRKFLQALQAGEMSVGRAVEILDAWVGGYYSDEMVPPPPADSCLIADDEFPMEIVRKLRSEVTAHPSPPEVMVGGWKPLIEAPNNEIVLVAAEFDGLGDWRIKCGYLDGQTAKWRVFGARWEPTHWMPLPPPPTSSADSKGK